MNELTAIARRGSLPSGRVRIARKATEAISRHLTNSQDREVGGGCFGLVHRDGAFDVITATFDATNTTPRSMTIDGASIGKHRRHLESTVGLSYLGVWHSHPTATEMNVSSSDVQALATILPTLAVPKALGLVAHRSPGSETKWEIGAVLVDGFGRLESVPTVDLDADKLPVDDLWVLPRRVRAIPAQITFCSADGHRETVQSYVDVPIDLQAGGTATLSVPRGDQVAGVTVETDELRNADSVAITFSPALIPIDVRITTRTQGTELLEQILNREALKGKLAGFAEMLLVQRQHERQAADTETSGLS